MRARLIRTLWLLGGVVLLGAGCTFNAVEPAIYTCSVAHPECPVGLTCIGGHCVKGGGDQGPHDGLSDQHSQDAPTTCGNGKVEAPEQCEGSNLNGASCQSLGKGNGTLACVKCAFDTSKCCTAPKPPLGMVAARIVSATTGEDVVAAILESAGNTGCVAYKTLSGALAGPTSLAPGAIIWVAPGSYTAGEKFPIVLKDVQIRGDSANNGDASGSPTLVSGSEVSGSERCTFLIMPGQTQLIGLKIDPGNASGPVYGVCVQDSATDILHNTYLGQGGVHVRPSATSSACPFLGDSVFSTSTMGVNMECTSGGTIRGNTFKSGATMIRVISAPAIEQNTFQAAANAAIFVEGAKAMPTITKNVFANTYGTAGIFFQLGGGTVRDNHFTSTATTNAVTIANDSAPDFGRTLNAGNNDFAGLTFAHKGTATINAIGNTWFKAQPPTCTQIVVTSTGKVQWGLLPTNSCPP
jgi:hypothetical protein